MKIKLNQKICDLFNAHYIRGFANRLYKPGMILKLNSMARIEEYARCGGNIITKMGAFSYMVSGDLSCIKMNIGKVCSIALGVQVGDDHHFIHSISASPYN